MPGQMITLCGNVAMIEVDKDHLGLDDIPRLGFAGVQNRAGHDEEGHAGIGSPERLGFQFGGKIAIGFDEGRMRGPVGAALFGKCADRHPVLAMAEDDVGIETDHCQIRLNRGGAIDWLDHDQHRAFQAQKPHSK